MPLHHNSRQKVGHGRQAGGERIESLREQFGSLPVGDRRRIDAQLVHFFIECAAVDSQFFRCALAVASFIA